MWWEIIPSGTIIGICLAIPQVASFYVCKATLGNGYRRKQETIYERTTMERDGRLTGACWRINGLEVIPDADNKTKK